MFDGKLRKLQNEIKNIINPNPNLPGEDDFNNYWKLQEGA